MKYLLFLVLLVSCANKDTFYSVGGPKDPVPTIVGSFTSTCFLNQTASDLNGFDIYTIGYNTFYEDKTVVSYSKLYTDDTCSTLMFEATLPGTWEVDGDLYKIDQTAAGGILIYARIKVTQEGLYGKYYYTPSVDDKNEVFMSRQLTEYEKAKIKCLVNPCPKEMSVP